MPDLAAQSAEVLVVDDNEQNRELARATLEDEGYTVTLCCSGEEALRAFAARPPDCVLLDVRMPGMDGFTVCSEIRRLPEGEHVPVIFLTAQRDVDTFDRALRAGADDFLTKPVLPTELVVRVRAALKLGRMNAELREHYDLVRRQRDELMRLQLQKEQLTTFVVHDLKNPINALDLHAQIALRKPELPDSVRGSVERIRSEARAMLRLVLNLLDISKSEQGALAPRPEPLALDALAGEIVEAFQARAKTARARLEYELQAPSVSADPDLLRRVLENLVDNAIRHAPEGSRVVLQARRLEGSVEVRVCDAGPGVPEEMRERIFDRFVQLDAGFRHITRAGRGLGLTFCKLAVEAHGGQMWIEDTSPGAAFCLRLPDAD